MDSDIEDENVDLLIDIDLIEDEQNPMYQNIDIQRKRLITVLDRALEKIGIAYVLEEILTKNISFLQNYMTQREIDSILSLHRFAKRLEKNDDDLRNTVKRISRRVTQFKSSEAIINKEKKSTSSIGIGISPSILIETDKQEQDPEKGSSPEWQIIRYYYSSIIGKLHFIPQVANLAKSLIYKKPVGTIKYYVYLKDLRDYVSRTIYLTKTNEVNYEKTVKQAYARNLKEKPQAEAAYKILQDKRKEKVGLEQQIKNDIEKEKSIQSEMNENLLSLSKSIIEKSEENIKERTENHHEIQEDNKVILAERTACYNKQLDANIASIKVLRKTVQKLEVTLRKIMDDYDNTIGELHEEFEIINDGFLNVEALYNDLKEKFDIQEEQYVELMAEKKEYVEMTCLRIRYNRGAKIVQRWWRKILWKKWSRRKTYLIAQLKKKDLTDVQRAQIKKNLKKILKLQKKKR